MEGEQPSSFQSISYVRAAELFPMPSLSFVDSDIKDPFTPLYGEAFKALGRTVAGTLALTNYRLFMSYYSGAFHNIPLGAIESIECREIIFLWILCKDGRSIRITFQNSESCQDWFRRLSRVIVPPMQIEDLFAFGFFAWAVEDENQQILQRLSNEKYNRSFHNEVSRLRFNLDGVWRISHANEDFQLCPTYPRQFLVPASVSDSSLEAVARFRVARRFPVVVWRNLRNGAFIARSSQPEVGILFWRCNEDEALICAMREACAVDSPTPELEDDPKRKILIMDARSYPTAIVNRARGGGVECNEYYKNCNIAFMSLPNIHAVRRSFHQVRTLCATPDSSSWLSGMENTKWLTYLAGLLSAAVTAAKAVDKDGESVLVHCSDGWDRTPQIVSLAQILLDPYYRTVQGFETLIQREWLDFGHKFGDRCGNSVNHEDVSERCPVFLQWLDCVHQLLIQFPCSFQYSEPLLIKLAHHTYSNLFGTFLGNSPKERSQMKIFERTFSVWPLLHDQKYKNLLYTESSEVLIPSCDVGSLSLWTNMYLYPPCKMQVSSSVQDRRCSTDGVTGGHSPVSKEIEKSLKKPYEMNGETETDREETRINGTDSLNGHDETDTINRCNLSSTREFSSITSNENWGTNGELNDLSHQGLELTDENSLQCPVDQARTWPRSNYTHTFSQESVNEHFDNSVDSTDTNSNNWLQSEKLFESSDGALEQSVCSTVISKQDWARSDEQCEPHEGILEQPVEQSVSLLEKDMKSWTTKEHLEVMPEQAVGNSIGSPVPSTPIKIPKLKPSPPSSFSDLSASIPFKFSPLRLAFDVDGLETKVDPVQMRVMCLMAENRDRVAALEQDLRAARLALLRRRVENNDSEDQVSTIGSDLNLASLPSDHSWEAVEERELQTTLWVPDHAVTECKSCSSRFWIGRRKHHCRKCGNIFCSDCSIHTALIPGEDLYYPVRVCVDCHNILDGYESKSQPRNGVLEQDSTETSTTNSLCKTK